MSFSSRVEDWRPLVTSMAGDLPVEFLMAWIQRESDGSPCSYPRDKYGNLTGESGIWQLMPPDNIAQAGTTLALQHPTPPCTPNTANSPSNASLASLTADQANEQVRAGIQYVNYCVSTVQAALTSVNADPAAWDPSGQDFWRLVKLVHAAPALVTHGLQLATNQNGQPPQSWDDFTTTAIGNNCWIGGCGTTLLNAGAVGAFGGGTPNPSIVDTIIVDTGGPILSNYLTLGVLSFVGLAIGWGVELFLSRRQTKRAGQGI